MKVLHIISGLNNGGAEAVLYRLATAGQQGGDHHHVVSLMGRGIYADRLEQGGVFVSTLEMPRGTITLRGLILLYQLIKQVQPDVVQTWMYHADLVGGIVATVARVKAIVWGVRHANFDTGKNNRVTLLIAKLCARLSSWVPQKIISCSVKATQLHIELGYQSEKFITIPNGYALDNLKPDTTAGQALRKELAIPNGTFVLGMVARYDPLKDHQNLIQALVQIKLTGRQFLCLLVGAGMDDSNSVLVTEIAAAGITEQVRLLGPCNEIPKVMNALDIHVLSSMGEAFPNVLAEAMACGTPCVTTNVGDAALIVGNHGWIVPARNQIALSEGLNKAITLMENNSREWHALKLACRAHIIENFELSRMCDSYKEAWKLSTRESNR